MNQVGWVNTDLECLLSVAPDARQNRVMHLGGMLYEDDLIRRRIEQPHCLL